MYDELVDKYEQFSDAFVEQIVFDANGKNSGIQIFVSCMNRFLDYEYERIRLIFEDVTLFRFIYNENMNSTFIFSALLQKEEDIITFDFFPLMFNDGLKEDVNSDLLIKCRNISYTIVK